MTKVPAPTSICMQVSTRAAQIAAEKMRGYGWSDKSISAIVPLPGEGRVGLKTSLKYLMYQEKGIQPFIMWWVEGRTLPLACKQGDGPHFRRGKDPGKPGWVNIPHVGKVWRNQKWRHPGLKPKNFLQDAIAQAIKETKPAAKQQLMACLKSGQKGGMK